ncbi:hypothetical protein [Kitasatospora sp. NPDC088134]|uniref:hypothetical protein n=1 Tax=Kitasatospora sp. NPDC088134 TaxID=3364071 RepID=UPI003804549E
MRKGFGPSGFADDVVLTAVALVRAQAAGADGAAGPGGVGGGPGGGAGALDGFVARHGIEACRALVAALTELVVHQTGDRTVLAERLEECEFEILTGTYWRRPPG